MGTRGGCSCPAGARFAGHREQQILAEPAAPGEQLLPGREVSDVSAARAQRCSEPGLTSSALGMGAEKLLPLQSTPLLQCLECPGWVGRMLWGSLVLALRVPPLSAALWTSSPRWWLWLGLRFPQTGASMAWMCPRCSLGGRMWGTR